MKEKARCCRCQHSIGKGVPGSSRGLVRQLRRRGISPLRADATGYLGSIFAGAGKSRLRCPGRVDAQDMLNFNPDRKEMLFRPSMSVIVPHIQHHEGCLLDGPSVLIWRCAWRTRREEAWRRQVQKKLKGGIFRSSVTVSTRPPCPANLIYALDALTL